MNPFDASSGCEGGPDDTSSDDVCNSCNGYLGASEHLFQICRICSLATITNEVALAIHTGVPAEAILDELEAGNLPGRFVHDRWLIHEDAIRVWLYVPHRCTRGDA